MRETVVSHGKQAFRLKGTAPALTLLYMLTEDLDAVEKQLSDHLRLMPQFFLYAPMLVDLTELGERRIDLAGLADLLRRHKLVPVAVRNPTDAQQVQAVQAGWAVLQSGLASPRQRRGVEARAAAAAYTSDPEESAAQAAAAAAPAPDADPSEQPLPGLTIKTPVRSGQVIHAVGGDLVVLAPVSVGAEIIADGNIHIYGTLRGRALAGAHGNEDARIFCRSLEADLVAIAGCYLRADEIPAKTRGKPAQIYLENGNLVVAEL
jgi:septum site-determining protein MinC